MMDIGKRFALEGLPEELTKQLMRTNELHSSDKLMIEILASYRGIANIDEVMVGYYKSCGEVPSRTYITNKLYRMAIDGKIKSLPKRKGVYSLNTYKETNA